ncbi:MAG: ABC transporter permease [Alphaproteobacteria bacterium]|nr:ABC transporter permease [Alphaproteobacteria bacterium]MBV9373392.1 ABC transporter permease [Alphaproteobacteria bacterium]MBV9900391.1 ABC transporter permease [Alphaproteobacteria bacterium]
MMSTAKASWVIARRDFVATVMSRSFIIFLLFPVLMIGFSIGFGAMLGKMERHENLPRIAVIASEAAFRPIAAAQARLKPAFREDEMAELVRVEPDYQVGPQIGDLLAAADKRFVAVLSSGPGGMRLTGAVGPGDPAPRQVRAILHAARQEQALSAAGRTVPPERIELVKVTESAGAVAAQRATTARAGQWLLFMVTVMLAGMLLSNMIEEKSNKVIEVLAAAVPIDAIFLGKLGAMLSVSLTGLALWAATAVAAVQLWPSGGASLPTPAVGWPLFILLALLYFSMNYLLLGALFLGLGSQASSVREVQSISMPVTIGQVFIFFFATAAAGSYNGLMGLAAAVFPFSSPMMMIARAAQAGELWPHLLALAWQALWVWLTVALGASLFRRNVLKSGGGGTRPLLRRRA